MNRHSVFGYRSLFTLIRDQLPSRASCKSSIRTLFMILIGAVILAPIVNTLPMLGFDWYYFFNAGNPKHSINSPISTYPPFANLVISLFTWMYWRHSLALLNAITLTAIAIGTWKQGGRYGSIFLALFNVPVLFLLWIGHPDSIPLVGVLTGFIPFILVKPQLAIWSILSCRKQIVWTIVFLLTSLVVWPMWFTRLTTATVMSYPAFGWPVYGWWIALFGIILFVGAGKNPYRLMAAGTFLTPYLLPYHLAILTPGIGGAKGVWKIIIWISAWLVAIGTGLGRNYAFINFIFPLAIYLGNSSVADYKNNVRAIIDFGQQVLPRRTKKKYLEPGSR